MTQFIDIHAHFDRYKNKDVGEVLRRLRETETKAIAVGTNKQTSRNALKLSKEEEEVFACLGIHPDDIEEGESFDDEFAQLASDPRVVAVGECGFDYFRRDRQEVKETQDSIFQAHIKQAIEIQKPLMLHIRPSKNTLDAYDDALEILESYATEKGEKLSGNAHFFAGDEDHLRRFLNIGFSISFTGVITFTSDYDQRVKLVPDDMLQAETDCPFVSPEPRRREENEPSFVRYVVSRMAEIRGQSPEELRKILVENAIRRFSLPIKD